jgi:FtsP/CotA-like multicopper oxidase with cupredoxin domain
MFESRHIVSRSMARLVVILSLFICDVLAAQQPPLSAQHAHVRIYFVSAEEVDWDYGPSGQDEAMGHPFDELERNYMVAGPHKIGRVYKKAVYREYLDAKFDHLKPRLADEQYLGILGPVMRAQVGDTIKVVFKNKASRPFSMHPHGVLYAKNSEGAMTNDGTSGDDKTDDAVPPGSTHEYIWEVPNRAGPGPGDPSSIVWLYHSHVDELRDVASGLFGAIIVTARGKATPEGRPSDVQREFVTTFITINENESWYLDENIHKFAGDPSGVNKKESIPEGPAGGPAASLGKGFADANLRNTVNGFMFGSMPMISMRKGERVRWHLLTLGDANNFHTPHWHGNVISRQGHPIDVIALSPAQMETADMVPDNPGVWLFHCHISDHMTAGMMTRYRVDP